MEIRVIGCHGGESPDHRTSAFVVGGRLAIDAGSLTRGLTLAEQSALEAVLVSHAHLDHVRDLATIADNRVQSGAAPLLVAGPPATIAALRTHFFNNVLWPDFTRLPSPDVPTIRLLELPYETPTKIGGCTVTSAAVSHTIEGAGFLVDDGRVALGYSGDTGPTERLWEVLAKSPRLRVVLAEVSVPDRLASFAAQSGHHTPATLSADLDKLERARRAVGASVGGASMGELAFLAYHMKPQTARETARECAKLKARDVVPLAIEDIFTF